jgi:hypothetical protein
MCQKGVGPLGNRPREDPRDANVTTAGELRLQWGGPERGEFFLFVSFDHDQ